MNKWKSDPWCAGWWWNITAWETLPSVSEEITFNCTWLDPVDSWLGMTGLLVCCLFSRASTLTNKHPKVLFSTRNDTGQQTENKLPVCQHRKIRTHRNALVFQESCKNWKLHAESSKNNIFLWGSNNSSQILLTLRGPTCVSNWMLVLRIHLKCLPLGCWAVK